MDFLEHCLQKYFEATGWHSEQQYSSLLKPSRELLDFVPPTGISFSISKSISDVLKGNYSLGLPLSGSLGFLFTSIPLDSSIYNHPDASKQKVYHRKTNHEPTSIPSYLLYGRLFRDARLDYIVARRLSRKTLFTMEGSSSWFPGSSYVNYLITHNRDRWGHEFSFSSESAMFGFRWLRKFSKSWQLGGEIYYLAQGVGGGMSFGVKRKSAYSITTLTIQPFLWNVSTTYSIHILPGFDACCRYDYNAYSYESDLSLGLALHPETQPRDGSCFRFCVGVKKGLTLMYQQNWDQLSFRLGFISNLKQNGIGLELSYVLR